MMTNAETSRPSSTLKRAFSQKGFVAAVLVLGVAAVGLNAATERMKLYFKKEAVPLRHSLDDPRQGIPERLGPWVQVAEQDSLDEDLQHVLGTDKYVFRTYLDTRAVPGVTAEALAEMSDEGREKLIRQTQQQKPEAIMSLAVTYYTGMVDTVAHVPDRCMVADGYEVREGVQEKTVTAGAYADGKPRQVKYRFIHFEDQTNTGRVDRNVGYLFHCNGGYVHDPAGVRLRLQNLFERHGYYAKVEMMTDSPQRAGGSADASQGVSDASVTAMNDLLTYALPEVERCIPDWAAVQARTNAGRDK